MGCQLTASIDEYHLIREAFKIIVVLLPSVDPHNIGLYTFIRSPGYGVTLAAESTTGVMYTAEAHCLASESNLIAALPEDIGASVASFLIEEIVKVCVCAVRTSNLGPALYRVDVQTV